MSNLPENGRIGNAAALASIDAKPGTSVWVDAESCEYVAVPTGDAVVGAVAGPTDPEPISWQPKGSRLSPTLGTPYNAEIAAGAGDVTLVTCPVTASRRQTFGVDWNVYNSLNTLAGRQIVVANRVGTAAPTIPSQAFDAGTVQTKAAWSPRAEVSGNDIVLNITADTVDAIRAKVRAELIESVDISDAPTATIGALITRLASLSGLWWRAADAVDAGGGVAATIPDAVANANTLTFSTAGSHTQPAISTLTGHSDVALICDGTQQAASASTLGSQTSHTVITVRQHGAGGIQSVSWGSGSSGTPGIIPGWNSNTPGIFVTSGWIATGTDSVAGAIECCEFWLSDTANEARVFRNGVQTGSTGTYSTSVAIAWSGFGCTDTTAVGGLYGRVTDIIYIPSAIGSSDRSAIYTLLKALHAVLP